MLNRYIQSLIGVKRVIPSVGLLFYLLMKADPGIPDFYSNMVIPHPV